MKIAIDLQNDAPTNGDVLKALFPDDNPVTAMASLDRTLRKWWNEPYVVSVDEVETIEDDCPETNRKKSERGETERSLLFAPSRRTVSTFIWEMPASITST